MIKLGVRICKVDVVEVGLVVAQRVVLVVEGHEAVLARQRDLARGLRG